MKEEKVGTAAELIFHNESNFYTILLFETNEEQFFAVGNMANPRQGRTYRLLGEWKTHPKYGDQFAFTSAEEQEPSTVEGIAAFLCSGIIKGIGPKMATAIVRRFGEDTLKVILNEPHRLKEVPGVGEAKAEAIEKGYKEHKEYADTVLALSNYDIPVSVCLKLYRTYGSNAPEIVRGNPYALIDDIYGVGFKKADKIAASVGIAGDSPFRIKSGILYYLSERAGSGDCYVEEQNLLEDVAGLLDVTRENVADAAFDLVMDGRICKDDIDGMKIFMLLAFYRAEKNVAFLLNRLSLAELKGLALNPLNMIRASEKESNMTLSEKQKNAVLASLSNGVLCITGGPGTGKTTIIRTILNIYTAAGFKTLLAAPTGRAAKRMQLACERPALTIHRMLEYSYQEGNDKMVFGRNLENPLDADCIIIDECSMVDILLMEALLKAIKPGCRLILVGDADQLPPVGAGNVLKDILCCDYIPSCKLTDIFRQAMESDIVVNAHLINKGEYPCFNEKDTDCFMLSRNKDSEISDTIVELCKTRLPAFYKNIDAFSDIQVLTPSRKGSLGSVALNELLQNVLNPPAPNKPEKKFGERIYRLGDKVMQIKNNYQTEWKSLEDFSTGTGIFNGDMGIISSVNNDLGSIGVLFDGDRLVEYDYSNVDELELAYALTVHKSQGSEFPVVVMPMSNFPPMLATRNLLYTAITRAKQGVVLVGNQRICNAMTDNNSTQKRNSALAFRLIQMWEKDN